LGSDKAFYWWVGPGENRKNIVWQSFFFVHLAFIRQSLLYQPAIPDCIQLPRSDILTIGLWDSQIKHANLSHNLANDALECFSG
jgi:hypothetical protein